VIDVLKKLPAIGSQSRAELSLSAVKVFRDDALAAGLTRQDARRRTDGRAANWLWIILEKYEAGIA
jgi:hypothetical protein